MNEFSKFGIHHICQIFRFRIANIFVPMLLLVIFVLFISEVINKLAILPLHLVLLRQAIVQLPADLVILAVKYEVRLCQTAGHAAYLLDSLSVFQTHFVRLDQIFLVKNQKFNFLLIRKLVKLQIRIIQHFTLQCFEIHRYFLAHFFLFSFTLLDLFFNHLINF